MNETLDSWSELKTPQKTPKNGLSFSERAYFFEDFLFSQEEEAKATKCQVRFPKKLKIKLLQRENSTRHRKFEPVEEEPESPSESIPMQFNFYFSK
jgi:hypothetical protein